MKLSLNLTAAALALLMLLGSHTLVYAQAAAQDPHHPDTGAEAAPAPDASAGERPAPQREGAPTTAGPGMMGGMMGPQMMQMMPQGMMGQGMMGQMPMMGMQPGMMGPMTMMGGMRGHGMLRMMFALMDADGDGALSLEEVQAAHERIFNAIDADNDGRVTLEELQAFFHGTARPAQPMQMRPEDMPGQEGMPMQQRNR